jgi:hypothetical protein
MHFMMDAGSQVHFASSCTLRRFPINRLRFRIASRNNSAKGLAMRTTLMLAFIALLALSGCSLHDGLFGLFGTYHSDGYSRSDRQRNYEESVSSH